MDPRVETHAELIVDRCTDVSTGDMVVVMAPPVAADLERSIYELVGERGGNPISLDLPRRAMRGYVRAVDTDDVETPEHALALLEAADVVIRVMGGRNLAELSDVDPESMQAFGRIQQPLMDEMQEGDLEAVITQHPAPGKAQKAGMSTDGYADFVYGAINKDWEAQEAFQAQLVDVLDPAADVRIVAGEETDLTMSIEGNPAVNGVPGNNLPGGEVFTAPVPASVEGTVRFDKPVRQMGREVEGAFLAFEGGEVVDHDAEANADVLAGVLNADEGARRLGELGIGMNRDIDRFTYNMLFDEKMGDTVHLALGRSIEESVGPDNEPNRSGMHVDMIVDMSEDSYIEVDGEVIQRDGTFRFEDGFEG